MFKNRAVKSYFNHWSDQYESDLASCGYALPQAVHDLVKETLSPKSDIIRILDIGVGTGLIAEQFRETYSCHITGIDTSQKMLNICKQKGVADELILSNILKEPLPVSDETYDLVILSGVLQFVPKPRHLFYEIERVLRVEGLAVVAHEVPDTVYSYKGGLLTGLIDSNYDRIVLRRYFRKRLLPRFYRKYLYDDYYVKNCLWNVDIDAISTEIITAYKTDDDKDIKYNLFLGRKRDVKSYQSSASGSYQ